MKAHRPQSEFELRLLVAHVQECKRQFLETRDQLDRKALLAAERAVDENQDRYFNRQAKPRQRERSKTRWERPRPMLRTCSDCGASTIDHRIERDDGGVGPSLCRRCHDALVAQGRRSWVPWGDLAGVDTI
jgi:ribosomal protein L32